MDNEQVNHPECYNKYPIEVIDMMEAIWGKEKMITFCEITAFKYRMRVAHKDNIETDLAKEFWYLNKAKQLKKELYGEGENKIDKGSGGCCKGAKESCKE